MTPDKNLNEIDLQKEDKKDYPMIELDGWR